MAIYSLVSPRKGKDKTFWHRVGTAFKTDNGFNLNFDSLPLPDETGRVSVFMSEQKEKNTNVAAEARKVVENGIDDDCPF